MGRWFHPRAGLTAQTLRGRTPEAAVVAVLYPQRLPQDSTSTTLSVKVNAPGATSNGLRPSRQCPQLAVHCFFSDDVLGGLFALNGGALPGPAGEVFYLAPDTLEWESCEMGYSDLVQWALVGDLAQFYEGFRWSGWQDDLKAWGPDRSLSIYPFLWSEGPAIDQRTRAPVDAKQAVNLELEFIRQLQTA